MHPIQLIHLPKILDNRGNLSFFESSNEIPFDIKRVYYIYDVPGGEQRGGHSYKTLHQLIIALSGSFDVVLDDGYQKQTFHLNRSYYALYLPPKVWRHMENFSTNSVAFVAASQVYDEQDYERDYKEFLKSKQ
jgi:glyoxylate utilization-related uncharacterized protein